MLFEDRFTVVYTNRTDTSCMHYLSYVSCSYAMYLNSMRLQLEGDSWRTASNDIVIAGLGWVSITGPGVCKIKVTVPKGTTVTVRPPLLPFEARETTVKFTGGKLLKRSKKSGDAGKSYGWRA